MVSWGINLGGGFFLVEGLWSITGSVRGCICVVVNNELGLMDVLWLVRCLVRGFEVT